MNSIFTFSKPFTDLFYYLKSDGKKNAHQTTQPQVLFSEQIEFKIVLWL
jgi:hypothetical protein